VPALAPATADWPTGRGSEYDVEEIRAVVTRDDALLAAARAPPACAIPSAEPCPAIVNFG
jgi:hypothetical protein